MDHVRQHQAAVRDGCDHQRFSVTIAERLVKGSDLYLPSLQEALEELTRIDPQQERIVELKILWRTLHRMPA